MYEALLEVAKNSNPQGGNTISLKGIVQGQESAENAIMVQQRMMDLEQSI